MRGRTRAHLVIIGSGSLAIVAFCNPMSVRHFPTVSRIMTPLVLRTVMSVMIVMRMTMPVIHMRAMVNMTMAPVENRIQDPHCHDGGDRRPATMTILRDSVSPDNLATDPT